MEEGGGVIPYGRQCVDEDDIAAVIEVLRSDWLTQGPSTDRFEEKVAAYCGVGHACATANATAALHLACLGLGLGPGDTLWTSPNTFVASANCALYCGAKVDFVDIDPQTYNMSVALLRDKLVDAKQRGTLPKVVVAVHFAGQACEMAEIASLATEYGFYVIEDASHAIGGRYRGEAVGCCRYSDMTIFSFHPVKIITTGEGGMVLTNNPALHDKVLMLRSHGITRDEVKMTSPSHGPWYYQQVDLGYNYRLTDIQAALGMSQMRRLDDFITRRRTLANRYDNLLADLPVVTPWRHSDCLSAWHLYVIRLAKETRRQVFELLRASGIGVNVHYIPVHTQPYYQALGFVVGDFPEAERYYEEALTLPLFPGLTDVEQERVISVLREALR